MEGEVLQQGLQPGHVVMAISLLVGALGTIVGAIWWLVRLAATKVWAQLDTRLIRIEEQQQAHQVAMREWETQLARDYVRREDWVRLASSIDAKLDRLNDRISELTRAELARLRDRT